MPLLYLVVPAHAGHTLTKYPWLIGYVACISLEAHGKTIKREWYNGPQGAVGRGGMDGPGWILAHDNLRMGLAWRLERPELLIPGGKDLDESESE